MTRLIGVEPSLSDGGCSYHRYTHDTAYGSLYIRIIAILYLLGRRTGTFLHLVSGGAVPSEYTSFKYANVLVDLFDRLNYPSDF
ncbi:hypothetical protein AK95_19325 [Paenibacillus sp. LC231]|uniref:hypothetical protein n=1 Tax=Paenibacillus sp. LC231 TaxID=1120679 RepID=UPI0008DE0495|nr:hypothetical protein [Paenibacillus sp. LC231]OIA99321.1 hypothetical protein AK95_19325 [Paenibacillus sp. LC231]